MSKKNRKDKLAPPTTPKQKTIDPAMMTKQSAMMMAVITLVIGFAAGVGFTVYKTGSTSSLSSNPGQTTNSTQQTQALEAEASNNPQNPVTWIQLGNSYYDADQHEKAIEAYEKALALKPNNADVLTDLGVMYRRNGQPRKAIESFDKAFAVNPQHETSRFNKGIVLLHDLEDREGAVRAWEGLLEINPLAMAGGDTSVDQLVEHYKKHAQDSAK
jgi:cytochrome c-type biogenesis protein CcmH/NrfG